MGSTGKELFVRKIEEKARWMPDHVFVRIPDENFEARGYRSITWRQYNDGVNKIAHWLDETLGKSVHNDTIAYFGANDIRYAFLFAALNKSNRKLLLPDGRLTKGALHSLLKASDCKAWLFSEEEVISQAAFGLEETGVKLQAFPSMEWCLDAAGAPPYPYLKTYDDSKHDEILIIHTSGTTGPPKPIYMNNGFWAAASASPMLSRRNWPRGISTEELYGRTLILACPMRWNSGLILTNAFGVFCNTCCVLPPADAVGLPPDLFLKLMRFNQVDGLVATPFTVVELFKDANTRPSLESLEFITYLGAKLDRTVGDALAQHTRLNSVIGATETGGRFSFLPKDKKLWYTFEFVPEASVRLVPIDKSGLPTSASNDANVYRMFIDRPAGESPPPYQCAFWNFRMFKDVDTIDTKELWRPIECDDGSVRWEFFSRADESVKLFGGVSFDAIEFETPISRHPGVKHVMAGGAGRPAPYVIIEMYDEALAGRTPESIVKDIFNNTIAILNSQVVKEIRIPEQTVFLTKKDKPFQLNLKQLVIRTRAEEDYKEEIEAAYERLEKTGDQSSRDKFLEFMK
ncbi:hypothetical protein DL762_007107 [Monosporascus cannonballus]|uniref:AMP-dependent synthetase/ligase domain-containing protein n=1 Tax=Monosporascus cannonballus TaxID=155416 RepID=A0ABY0H080_9PEZI|nr:hypothetical protein DL762_007107 [Monosporascus cannonballus]RYP01312.1 hypothetical protein DL763_000284 [Monosporascus cannonballus]